MHHVAGEELLYAMEREILGSIIFPFSVISYLGTYFH